MRILLTIRLAPSHIIFQHGGVDVGDGAARDAAHMRAAIDFTCLPKALNKRAARLDVGGSLRTTKIKVGPLWARKRQAGLIASKASREAASLADEEQATERAAAFDLLDALTRSGALAIEAATVHIVIASTHCFARCVSFIYSLTVPLTFLAAN